MVNVPGTVLKNMTITGNLIVGDGVGNGEVTLENVVVTGTAIVRGGGVNSIRIVGNSNIKNIVIARVNGEVRVFADDGTEVGTVIVDGDDNVIIEGDIGEIRVETSNVTVTARNATIDSIVMNGAESKIVATANSTVKNVTVNAKDAEIAAEKGSNIKKVEANQEGIKISGTGAVYAVKANANNIVVTTKGTSVTAATGTTGVVAGSNNVSGGSTTTVSDSTTNTGGGGGGGGGSSSIAVSAINVTGTTAVGQTLTANATPTNATVSYQWMRCDTATGTFTNITGATSKTYTLVNADLNQYIKVDVTGTGSYTGTQTSVSTGVVLAAPAMQIPDWVTYNVPKNEANYLGVQVRMIMTDAEKAKIQDNDVVKVTLLKGDEALATSTLNATDAAEIRGKFANEFDGVGGYGSTLFAPNQTYPSTSWTTVWNKTGITAADKPTASKVEIIRGGAVISSTTTTANLNETFTDAESTTGFTWDSIFN